MNRYGAQAMRHWQTYDPAKYQAIEDPQTFFTELGDLAETQIQSLEHDLAGSDPPQESYLEKVGRLRMARLQAEEQILAELILIPSALPEDQTSEPTIADSRLQTQQDLARIDREMVQQEIDAEIRAEDPSSPPPPA